MYNLPSSLDRAPVRIIQRIRHVSTASAIQRGVGKSQRVALREASGNERRVPWRRGPTPLPFPGHTRGRVREKRVVEEEDSSHSDPTHNVRRVYKTRKLATVREDKRPGGVRKTLDNNADIKSFSWNTKMQPKLRKTQSGDESLSENTELAKKAFKPPPSVSYTTAASEFLYGRAAVEAALSARRRKLYKLYFDNTAKIDEKTLITEEPIIKKAYSQGLDVQLLRREDAGRLLDKMSERRPHNGFVLEASPLPKIPCVSLGHVDTVSGAFKINRASQSPEDLAITGRISEISFNVQDKVNPFVLFLDGIIDPGNLGAILRSAFFLGVDAAVITTHGAPLKAVALKASAGAAEILPILSVHKTGHFLRSSQANGWKVFAAVPERPTGTILRRKPFEFSNDLESPLSKAPTVLMLGGEATGLWDDLQAQADSFVSIPGSRAGKHGVDSLNVSVAAAILIQAFMKQTPQTPTERMWEAN